MTQLAPMFFDMRITAKDGGGKMTITVMNTYCAFCIVLNGTINTGNFDAGVEVKRLSPFLKSSKPTSQLLLEQHKQDYVTATIHQADTCTDECRLAYLKLEEYQFKAINPKLLDVQLNVLGKSFARSVHIHNSQNSLMFLRYEGKQLRILSARNIEEVGVDCQDLNAYKSMCKSTIPPIHILPGSKEGTSSQYVECNKVCKIMKMVRQASAPVRVAFSSANFLSFTGSYDTTIPTVFEARVIFTEQATSMEDE
jgi:hypothetical protein